MSSDPAATWTADHGFLSMEIHCADCDAVFRTFVFGQIERIADENGGGWQFREWRRRMAPHSPGVHPRGLILKGEPQRSKFVALAGCVHCKHGRRREVRLSALVRRANEAAANGALYAVI